MSKESFVKSAAILSIAGLLVKVLGAIYRIPLTNLIGTEGIGYYQPAYNVYNLLLVVSLNGFPTAIARLVSERRALKNYEGAYQVFKISRWGLFLIGIISSLFILLFAENLVSFLGFPGSYYSMLALVPALFAVPLLSAYRGYFQGTQNMTPIALSQVIEQIFRVAIGLYLAVKLVDVGLEEAAAGATFGASAGAVFALILIVLIFMLSKNIIRKEIKSSTYIKESNKEIVTKLLSIAIPITIGASIAPLMGLMDSYIVSSRLSAIGYTQEQIADMFGELSGTAQTLINFPQVFSTAVAMSLVPAITGAFTKNQVNTLNKTSNAGVKISLIIGLPCGIGLYMLAEPIIALLYASLGPEKHASAGNLLEILAISVIFLTLVQAFTAILQSIDKQMEPVKNLFWGLIIKVILSYILIGMPSLNIRGAAISTTVAYLAVALLNWKDINRKSKIKIKLIQISSRPLLSSAIMALVVWITFKLFSAVFSSRNLVTLLSISCAVLAYGVSLILTGAITEDDLELIPKGEKLKRFVRK